MKVADQEKHVTAGKARTRWDLPATGRACARWGSPVADGAHAWRSTRLWLVVLAPGKAHPGSVVSAANNGARARWVSLAVGGTRAWQILLAVIVARALRSLHAVGLASDQQCPQPAAPVPGGARPWPKGGRSLRTAGEESSPMAVEVVSRGGGSRGWEARNRKRI